MLGQATLQAEREKRETVEFIETLKTLSETERAEVQRGYMKGISTVKCLATDNGFHKS